MEQKISLSLILPIGLMLFSFFFGAGNFIFPPVLGQAAGDNLLSATIGFCISGVGLPLLGIIAMAINRSDNPDNLASPVHPNFAKALVIICALTIGPFFAIPRTAAVSFDTGILAFVPAGYHDLGMIAYSLFFFLLTYYLSVNPSKIIDNIGKIMTPMLLICLAILIAFVLLDPLGPTQAAQGDYAEVPFFKGFQEGYNTMDLLAAMLFGAATVNAIESKGILDHKLLTRLCIYAGIIAATFLALIYSSLAYTGATSVQAFGIVSNGGQLLNQIAVHYMGNFGKVILALIIFFACITTSIGLTSSISGYFNALFNEKIQYQRYVLAISVFSFAVSNVGLSNIIKFSIPVLCMLYPIVIVLVLLNVCSGLFKRDPYIFRPCVLFTTIFAILDGLKAAGINTGFIHASLEAYMPLYNIGFGWVVPCIAGIVLGFIWKACAQKN
jgi:LIVCS family branched-chain amino acid:cation transporter